MDFPFGEKVSSLEINHKKVDLFWEWRSQSWFVFVDGGCVNPFAPIKGDLDGTPLSRTQFPSCRLVAAHVDLYEKERQDTSWRAHRPT